MVDKTTITHIENLKNIDQYDITNLVDIPFYITQKVKGLNITFWIDYKDPSAILNCRIKRNGFSTLCKISEEDIKSDDTADHGDFVATIVPKKLLISIGKKVLHYLLRACPKCSDNYIVSGVLSLYYGKFYVHTLYNETQDNILPLHSMLEECGRYKLDNVVITTSSIYFNDWTVKSLEGLATKTNGLVFTPVNNRWINNVYTQFCIEV